MTPLNERPTPLTDALRNKLEGAMSAETNDALDLASDLERSLAERTEERDKVQQDCESYCCTIDMLTDERDNALAKLAKCREALELFDLGVGFGVTEQMYDKRKSALEETK